MVPDSLADDLSLIADGVIVVSSREYCLYGLTKTFDDKTDDDSTAYPANAAISRSLERDLYAQFYCRPSAVSAIPYDPLAQRAHIAALSDANNGTGTWEPGWRIVQIQSEHRIAVCKDRVVFWIAADGLRTRAKSLRVNASCRVRVGKELRYLMPGFYFAIGNGSAARRSYDAEGSLVRLYWHLRPGAAVPLIALVTRLFNVAQIPFRVKVLTDVRAYCRADAGVLYIEKRFVREAAPLIRSVYGEIAGGLRPEVPMFTKQLAPGLGLAEDPGGGRSFGQARCRVIAEGLWKYKNAIEKPADDAVAFLVTELRRHGLNPKHTYRNARSSDRYEYLVLR